MNNILDKTIISAYEEDEFSMLGRLIELGRLKGYVTIDDILAFYPEAEQNVGQLEEAFAALLSVGVPYVEDSPATEPSDQDLTQEEDEEKRKLQRQPKLTRICSPISTQTI